MEHTETVDPLEEMVDEAEAAPLVRQNPRTLTVWRSQGKGPRYVKLGRKVFYRKSDLRDFVRAQTIDPESRS